ncbi:hypothetical protein EMCRGX_G010320 [Ephydatia muelleri]
MARSSSKRLASKETAATVEETSCFGASCRVKGYDGVIAAIGIWSTQISYHTDSRSPTRWWNGRVIELFIVAAVEDICSEERRVGQIPSIGSVCIQKPQCTVQLDMKYRWPELGDFVDREMTNAAKNERVTVEIMDDKRTRVV